MLDESHVMPEKLPVKSGELAIMALELPVMSGELPYMLGEFPDKAQELPAGLEESSVVWKESPMAFEAPWILGINLEDKHQPKNQPINQPINQSINQSLNQPEYKPTIHKQTKLSQNTEILSPQNDSLKKSVKDAHELNKSSFQNIQTGSETDAESMIKAENIDMDSPIQSDNLIGYEGIILPDPKDSECDETFMERTGKGENQDTERSSTEQQHSFLMFQFNSST